MANKDTPNYNNWVKSFSKVVGKTTKDVLRTVTPNIVETVTSANDSIRDVRSYISHARNGMGFQSRTLEATRMGRSARDIMNSAFDDIRRGTFSLKGMSDDSYNIGDIEPDVSTDDSFPDSAGVLESRKNTAILGKVVAEGNAATIEGLRQMTETVSNVTLKSASATADRLSNVALFGFNKMSSDLSSVNRNLTNVNANLSAIIKFQNTNMNVVNQAALKYYDTSTKMLYSIGQTLNAMKDANERMQKMSNDRNRWDSNKFGIYGGMNFRDYGKFIKGNFQNSLYGSMLSMYSTASKMGGGFKGSDIISQLIAGLLIPSSVKKSLGSLDKNADRYMKNILYRIGDLGDYSNTNPFTQFLGEIFGMKRLSVAKIGMGNFKKDYMGWNGVAQKTLVEVIPSYLANIEAALTKRDKRYYDMEKGTFKTEGQVSKQFMDEYQSKIEYSMMLVADKITKSLNATNKSAHDKQSTAEAISEIINDRVTGSRKNDRSYTKDMHSLLSGIDMKDVREIMLDLEDSIRDTVENINEMNKSIEDSISGSVYRNLFNSEGGNTSHLRKRPNIFLHGQFSRSGKSYSSMSEEDIRRDIEERRIENDLKDKGKRLKNRFNKETRGKWASDRIEDVDNYLYQLYSKAMDGDISFDTFRKMVKKTKNATAGIDKRVVSSANKMRGIKPSSISKMSRSDFDSLNENAAAIMDDLKKTSSSSSFSNEVKSKDEAIISIANDNAKNTKTLQSLVAGLFSSLTSMIGGVFGKDGIIGKFFHNDSIKKIAGTLKKKFFDENDGLFAPLVRHFKDGVDYLKYAFTGKGYTNRQGKKFADSGESVLGYIKNGYNFIFHNTMKHVFGEKYENNQNYNKYFKWMDVKNRKGRGNQRTAEAITPEEKQVQEEIFGDSGETITRADGSVIRMSPTTSLALRGRVETHIANAAASTANKLEGAGDTLTETLFGEESTNKEKLKKDISGSFFSKFKKNLPKILTAGVIGGAVGLANGLGGGGVIGSLFLPSGIIGGAIAGIGLQLASRSQKVQDFIFGTDDGNGGKTGGLISKKTTSTFKKLLPAIVGGATIGVLKNVVFGESALLSGPSGFLLNTLLPGGVIGGALLGVGVSLLKNNEKFNRILFGKKSDSDGNSTEASMGISKGFAKVQSIFAKSSKFIKGGLKGLGIGAVGGLALSKLGLIGSAMSLGGPIGMGIAGLGIGIASQAHRFQEFLFGTKEIGPDGKPTGKVFKDGLMHQVRNMLMINVFEPIKDKLDSEVTKFAYWAKDKITYPFRLAFGPIIDSMKDFKDDIGDFVKAKFEKLTDGIGEVLHTGLKKIFEPFTSLIGRIGKGLIGGLSFATKMALSPVTGALGLASFMVGGKRSRDKAAFLKSTVKNEYGILRDKWANDEANATDTSLGARARRMAGRFGDIRKAYQTGRQAWNDRMTAEGRNSLNWRGVKDERKQDKLDLKDEKTTEKMWSKINKLRKGYMERDNFKEVYWSDKTADEMRKKFIASGVDENWIKTNDDLRDLIYDREKWKDKWNPNKPNNSTTSVMNIEETPEQRAAREATMAHQNIVEKWLADIYDVMAEAAGVYSGSDRRKEGDKEVKRARRALKRRHMSVDDLGLSDDELKDYADMPAYEFDNYRNSEYYETKDFRGWYNANVGRFGKFNEYPSSEAGFSDSSNNTTNSSKTPTEAIINMSRTINDNLETQNKISTGIVEAATGGALDSDKMQISDQQAAEAHTSTAELAKAQEKGILNGLTSLWKKKSKQSKRDAQLAAEASESAAAQSMNTLDTADIAVLSGEGDGNEETDKVQGKSTGFLGKVGNFFNWFTSSGNWIKLLAGAGISYLFKDQILSISEALPELVTKYAPKIQGAISKFIDKYGAPIIEAATSTITSLMPSLIKSAFSITQSLFSNLFTSIKTSLGFGDDSSTVSADQATSLDAAGINYITNGDGTLTVPGSRTVFNEDGSMSSVSNTGLQSATFKLARNMITNKNTAKAVARIAGKSVGAIGKIVTAPLRLVPGGKVAANMVSSAAGIATNAAVNAGGKAASVIKTAATSTTFKQKLIKWCMGVFDKFDGLTKNPKILKVIDGTIFGKAITKLKDAVMKGLVNADDKIAAKLLAKATNGAAEATGKLAATGTLILPAFFAVYDAITGAMEAENLFDVNSDAVDWKMRLISSLMKTILGFSIGPFVDILLEIGADLTGIDLKKQFAMFIYDLLSDDDDVAKLKTNQEKLEIETKNYNDANGTNLTASAYTDLKNSPWWKQAWNWITGKKSEDFSKYEVENYSTPGITQTSSGNVSIVGYGKNIPISTSNKNKQPTVGYGNRIARKSGHSVGYGTVPILGVSQSDPRWGNYPLGTFPDGSISTMSTGGCGPTALSMVTSSLNGKNYDPLNVARYAKQNGYLAQGGATEELFTDGASDLGLSSSKVSKSGIKAAVKSGQPVILAGKSAGNASTPYTDAGHIIVASDYDSTTDKVVISDPMYGYSQEKKISDLTAGMTHAWQYSNKRHSEGYGRGYRPSRHYIGFGNYAASHNGKQTQSYMDSYSNYQKNGGSKSYIDIRSSRDDVYNKYFNDSYMSNGKFDEKKLPMSYNNYTRVLDRIGEAIASGTYPKVDISGLSPKAESIVNWFIGKRVQGYAGYDFGIGDIMYTAQQTNRPSSFKKYMDMYWNRPLTKGDYEYVESVMSGQGTGLIKYDDSLLTSANQLAAYRALRGSGSPSDNAIVYKYNSNFAEKAGILAKEKTGEQLKSFYNNGFLMNTAGIMNFNDPAYYIGLRNDDVYNLAKMYPSLLSTDYPLFTEIYRNFMGSASLVKNMPSFIANDEIAVVDQALLDKVSKRAAITAMLGGSTYGNAYDTKNGFPFFNVNDKRWKNLNWGFGTMGKTGSDIASLAMISSAFGNNIIPPDYILNKWIPMNQHWWNYSGGLTPSVFGPNGFQKMSSTFVDGKPLLVSKLQNTSSILEALKARKPVYMTGYKYNGSMFGGTNDKTDIRDPYKKSNRNSVVGVYSDGQTIAVNDPTTGATDYALFDSSSLTDTVGTNNNVPVVKEAYMITKPDGTGLDANVDLSGKSGPTTKHKNLADYSGLDKLSAFISNFASIGENMLNSKFDSGKYKSIYDVDLAKDDYTGDTSVQGTLADNEVFNIGNGRGIGYGVGHGRRRRRGIGYGPADALSSTLSKLAIAYNADIASRFGEDYDSAKARMESEASSNGIINGSMPISSNLIDLSNASSEAKAAAKLIFSNEGNYQSINGNDKGAVSLGKIQWHGPRAKNLMAQIRNSDQGTFDRIASENSAQSLINAVTGSNSWKTYTMMKGSAIYDATSSILGTAASRSIQDSMAIADVEKYIEAGRKAGLTDSQALIYYADFANQYGINSSVLSSVVQRAIANGGSLDAMYNATKSVIDQHLPRRKRVYESIKAAGPVGYGIGGNRRIPTEWFTYTPNRRAVVGYGGRLISHPYTSNSGVDSNDVSISRALNIHNSRYKSVGYGFVDTGDTMRDNSAVIKKLNVAVNTQGVENKLDAIIEIMKLMMQNDTSVPSGVTNNNFIGYGPGKARPANQVTIIKPNSGNNPNYELMNIKSIHDALAKRP
jgi:hypothetical protein